MIILSDIQIKWMIAKKCVNICCSPKVAKISVSILTLMGKMKCVSQCVMLMYKIVTVNIKAVWTTVRISNLITELKCIKFDPCWFLKMSSVDTYNNTYYVRRPQGSVRTC